jgi:hypothetical protein
VTGPRAARAALRYDLGSYALTRTPDGLGPCFLKLPTIEISRQFCLCSAFALLGISGLTVLWLAARFTFLRSRVTSVSKVLFFATEDVTRFVWQSAHARDLNRFRALVPTKLRSASPAWAARKPTPLGENATAFRKNLDSGREHLAGSP